MPEPPRSYLHPAPERAPEANVTRRFWACSAGMRRRVQFALACGARAGRTGASVGRKDIFRTQGRACGNCQCAGSCTNPGGKGNAMTLSWVVAIIAGIAIGLAVHSAVGGRRSAALSALAGLVGAVVGRTILGHSFHWHPHFLGSLIGAIVLAIIWVFATRGGAPRQPAAA